MIIYIYKFEIRYNLKDYFNQFVFYIIDFGKDFIDGQFDDFGLYVIVSYGESFV